MCIFELKSKPNLRSLFKAVQAYDRRALLSFFNVSAHRYKKIIFKVHILGLNCNLSLSFKAIGTRNAALAWLKKNNYCSFHTQVPVRLDPLDAILNGLFQGLLCMSMLLECQRYPALRSSFVPAR